MLYNTHSLQMMIFSLHFPNEETQAQSGAATCPRSHRQPVEGPGAHTGSLTNPALNTTEMRTAHAPPLPENLGKIAAKHHLLSAYSEGAPPPDVTRSLSKHSDSLWLCSSLCPTAATSHVWPLRFQFRVS